jgi:hypothetical protein
MLVNVLHQQWKTAFCVAGGLRDVGAVLHLPLSANHIDDAFELPQPDCGPEDGAHGAVGRRTLEVEVSELAAD